MDHVLIFCISGIRNSVSSGTDTSFGFESDKDEPPPLPPPRPKHWARMIKAKTNQQEVKDAVPTQTEVVDKSTVPDKSEGENKLNDDWFEASLKLPMPLFKPTAPTGKFSNREYVLWKL